MLWADLRLVLAGVLLFCGTLFGQNTPGSQQPTGSGDAEKPQKPASAGTHEETIRPKFDNAHKDQGEIRFRYARELRSYGYAHRARTEFETFLLLFPGHPRQVEACIEIGEIAQRLGQPAEAVKYYLKAYHGSFRDERGALAAVRAARILIDLGEGDRASEILDEIVRQWPSSRPSRLAEAERALLKGGSTSGQPDEMPEKEGPEKPSSDEDRPEKSDNRTKDPSGGRDLMGEGVEES